ncbi:MAG: substrate-binding domain-containing protein, partial [Verrucomicrobiales bacterium]|nr:substrate-binding domain-containing protein [Verrucomicrobiales bacterium]
EFRDREGIELTTVFNGCGILCAAMQTMTDSANPRFPDAYFACDLCFVPPVAEHFSEVVLLTETDIGIAVPVENRHGIKTLTDLAKPGLKVGLCNQKQSTLGYMTQGILKSTGLEASIRKNMAVEVPTADFLITQLRSGALDAAIVYRVNAELQKEHIKFIKINHKGAKAVQPFSVRSDSEKRQLASRLQDHFLAHPEVFEETGLKWRGDEGVMKSSDIEIPEWLISR